MIDPILKLILDALSEAHADVNAGCVSLGQTRRAAHANDSRQNMKNLFSWTDSALGEKTLEDMRAGDVSIVTRALELAYDQGYEQACRDVHDDVAAYLKGLN